MACCLDVASWRVSTSAEVAAYLDSKKQQGRGDVLVIRKHLKPVDVYSYLVARFGQPNGMQNMLRRDSSDNWIHWDFNLKAQEADVYLAGASREIHIMTSERLLDEEWKCLILAIKADFRRVGKEKSAVIHSFEKFAVFQNKFVSIANLCADLHAAIVDAPPAAPVPRAPEAKEDIEKIEAALRQIGERGEKLFGDSLKLQLLTPVMAEAFINMVILTFCKDEIRKDRQKYEAFVRETIPTRIDLLTKNCDGFIRSIDTGTEAYANFMRVVARRNFALHGNIDPVRETLEIVYFDGRRPLFVEPGHHIEKLFEHLEAIHRPGEAAAEYEHVHIFLAEIVECLDKRRRVFFEQVISDGYPGYELRKSRVTRILLDQVMMCLLPGMRYDDQLKVTW